MITAVEILLVLVFCLPFWSLDGSRSPLLVLPLAVGRLASSREFRRPFLFALGLLAFNLIETRFDDRLTAALGYDATPWIHRLEGDLGSAAQRFSPQAATAVFAFFYIVLCPVLIVAPLFLAAARDDLRAFRALCRGIVLNYGVCFPFYLFFPVKEMWAGSQKVHLLLDRFSPAIMEAYRASSALDNCFPSFHVSLSLTLAILASKLLDRRFALLAWGSAIAIVFSTVYLGIHWLSDVAAGTALAVFAAWAADRPLRGRRSLF